MYVGTYVCGGGWEGPRYWRPYADLKPRRLFLWQAGLPYKSRNVKSLVDRMNCCNDEEHGIKFLNACSKNGRRYKRWICRITWGLETCGIIQELTGR